MHLYELQDFCVFCSNDNIAQNHKPCFAGSESCGVLF